MQWTPLFSVFFDKEFLKIYSDSEDFLVCVSRYLYKKYAFLSKRDVVLLNTCEVLKDGRIVLTGETFDNNKVYLSDNYPPE